jgi:glycosyltransferase involved in cell wall biosynthesis
MPARTPTVSIIMPLYNARRWVAGSIASVQAQTFSDWELVVVNDGSTDGGEEIVSALAAKDTRIRLVRQANAGPSAARNRGVREARSPWIAFLDSDDLLPPERLAEDLKLAAAHPRAAAVAGSTMWFDKSDPTVEMHKCLLDASEETIRWRHSFYSVVNCCALLLRREVFEATAGFSTEPALRYAEDYEFTLRLLERIEFAGTDRVLVYIRKHEQNRSSLAADLVATHSVEAISRHWTALRAPVPRETLALAARFWRLEPDRFTAAEFGELIQAHTHLAAAFCQRHRTARKAVQLDWERRLASRLVESRLSKAEMVRLGALERAERGAAAALRVFARCTRLRLRQRRQQR